MTRISAPRRILTAFALAALVTPMASAPALAQGRDGQGDARRELSAGNVLPLSQIERSVLPRMRGADYIGPEFDGRAMKYRLKFVQDGRVVVVTVDARNGRILSKR